VTYEQRLGPGGVPSRPAPSISDVGLTRSQTSFVAQGTRIDVNDQARQIGTQIAAVDKGFLTFDRIASDIGQLRADYERLRLSHELSREIAAERDTTKLLEKILASVFKFIRADRGVIFLRDDAGDLTARAMQRRDGTTAPITVSSTILNHVVKERAAVLTHDAAMDFAASKGKSMILNRISSAVVAPLVAPLQHNNEVLGVLWLDSENLAQFQPKDLELVLAIAYQAAMFIEINILGKKVENEMLTRERFSRLLSPSIAERVISGQLEVKPGGQRVEQCTVFNSDIRGFTQMSESTSPEELVEMLNEYFELMVDTIFKFEGTLDKFMGDGIMALWGTPVVHPDDSIRGRELRARDGRGAREVQPAAPGDAEIAARRRHRHPHRARGRRLHRQLQGLELHGHRRRRQHVVAPLLGGPRGADRDQRDDARAARRALRDGGASAREGEGQGEAAPHLQRAPACARGGRCPGSSSATSRRGPTDDVSGRSVAGADRGELRSSVREAGRRPHREGAGSSRPRGPRTRASSPSSSASRRRQRGSCGSSSRI
jgi:adenylate cyclase